MKRSIERAIRRAYKKTDTFPNFTRSRFNRKRNIVERCRIPNERKNRPPLTSSIASNQYTPKKFPICTKNISWKDKKACSKYSPRKLPTFNPPVYIFLRK